MYPNGNPNTTNVVLLLPTGLNLARQFTHVRTAADGRGSGPGATTSSTTFMYPDNTNSIVRYDPGR
jgi:hypothetical protein